MSIAPEIVTPEIVTLENLRRITRQRALGYAITLVLIGVLEVLWFGGTRSALKTTIEFGYNSSTVMPSIAAGVRIIPLLLGLLLLAPVVSPSARNYVPARFRFTKAVRNCCIVVGGYLVLWPLALWFGVNSAGALRTLTIPVSATGYVVGLLTVVAGGLLAWKRYDRGRGSTLVRRPDGVHARLPRVGRPWIERVGPPSSIDRHSRGGRGGSDVSHLRFAVGDTL